MIETFIKLKEKFKGNSFVDIDPNTSTIKIKIQDGPIQEYGINGTQIDELGKIWLSILYIFNEGTFRCRENSISITKIEEALMWQEARTKDRITRLVEGYNKP